MIVIRTRAQLTCVSVSAPNFSGTRVWIGRKNRADPIVRMSVERGMGGIKHDRSGVDKNLVELENLAQRHQFYERRWTGEFLSHLRARPQPVKMCTEAGRKTPTLGFPLGLSSPRSRFRGNP